jgi:hypothetical protein
LPAVEVRLTMVSLCYFDIIRQPGSLRRHHIIQGKMSPSQNRVPVI